MDEYLKRSFPLMRLLKTLSLAVAVCTATSSIAAPSSPNLIELEQVISRAAPPLNASSYLARLLSDPATQEIRWVAADPTIISEATQEIRFPVSQELTVTFRLSSFKKSIDGMVVWIGDIPSDRKTRNPGVNEVDFDPFNSAVIVRNGDKLMGTFMVRGQSYSVEAVDGRHTLLKLNGAELGRGEASVDDSAMPADYEDPAHKVLSASSVIRVMVVTTNQMRETYPNLNAGIVNAINSSNQAFVNSGVNMKFQLAKIYEAQYDEVGNSGAMLSQLVDFQSPLGKAVLAKRELYLADVVTMAMTSSEYCGQAKGWASRETAYSVINCLGSMTHEILHNFGALHKWEPGDPVTSPSYRNGYVHRSAPDFGTIMAGNPYRKINLLSTPLKNYEGVAVGTVINNDMARFINERREDVEEFYPGNHDGYTPYLNRYMLDSAQALCIQTNSVDDKVAMKSCSSSNADDQNSMREWKAVPQGSYWHIKNHFKDLQGKGDVCLMSTRNDETVEMGACDPPPGQYSSQRLWTLASTGEGLFELRNKYKADAGKGNCVRTFAQNKNVLLDTCEPNDSTGGFVSMRRWNWQMFE